MKTFNNEFTTTVQSISMYSSAAVLMSARNTRGLCGLVWCKANLSKGEDLV